MHVGQLVYQKRSDHLPIDDLSHPFHVVFILRIYCFILFSAGFFYYYYYLKWKSNDSECYKSRVDISWDNKDQERENSPRLCARITEADPGGEPGGLVPP